MSERMLAVLALDQIAAGNGAGATVAPDVLRAEIARDLAQLGALRAVIDALGRGGVASLVMKGAALSLTCYPQRFRPRSDDDLLVAPEDFVRAGALLVAHGYRPAVQITAPGVTGQQAFSSVSCGILHHVDLHARPLNPAAFGEVPSFSALLAASVPLSELGAHARGLGRVDALLLACAHRVAHHTPTADPLWLFDIHLLASALDDAQWPQFVARAVAARTARISASELTRAAEVHHTAIPDAVMAQLREVTGEPTARHLHVLGSLHIQWLNVRHAPGWRARLALVRGHLVPPARYMRERYDDGSDVVLPRLYARRAITGLARWMRELIRRRSDR